MQSHASIFLVPRFSITLCLPATQRLSALSLASPPCNILTASSLVSASSSPIKIQPVRPTLGANRYTCATTRGLQPTYTHDRPFSKREIGLTPHSPSGSLPTQKGKSRPLGTWILDKLRPLCANAHVQMYRNGRVMQSPSHRATIAMCITQTKSSYFSHQCYYISSDFGRYIVVANTAAWTNTPGCPPRTPDRQSAV